MGNRHILKRAISLANMGRSTNNTKTAAAMARIVRNSYLFLTPYTTRMIFLSPYEESKLQDDFIFGRETDMLDYQ